MAVTNTWQIWSQIAAQLHNLSNTYFGTIFSPEIEKDDEVEEKEADDENHEDDIFFTSRCQPFSQTLYNALIFSKLSKRNSFFK